MSVTQAAPPIIVEPVQEYKGSVIWLHGLGASAEDFHGLLPAFPADEVNKVRWVFPNAPVEAVTINGGMPMPSWFDITSLAPNFLVNEEDVEKISQYINSLLEGELTSKQAGASGKAPLYLVGFSQGGVMAVHAGLKAVADGLIDELSILGLSCCHPALERVLKGFTEQQLTRVQKGINVCLMHGEYDEVVAMKLGEQCWHTLTHFQISVEWKTYPMAHQVCPEQIKDIAVFLNLK